MDGVHHYPSRLDEQGASSGILRCFGVCVFGVAIGMYDSSIDATGVGFQESGRDYQHLRDGYGDADEWA